MGKEYSTEEIETVVEGVEECYEQILREDLIKGFARFRIQSHYNAYLTLKIKRLELFDENGMISRAELMGVDIRRHLHTYEVDEFGAIYFFPIDSERLLDGEEVITRLLYYYAGRKKRERANMMRELLEEYRKRFRVPAGAVEDAVPGNSCNSG